jgi:uncharacterized membrane protein
MLSPNPKSTAQIAGHPIHPMLVPFPIAFFVGAFVTDILFWRAGTPGFAAASLWLLGAGLVMAALAALMGLIDLFGEPKIRRMNDAWQHAGGNIMVVLIETYNFYIRYPDPPARVVPLGLALSLIVVVILLFTGWKGGEMVYRHRVGVADADRLPPM